MASVMMCGCGRDGMSTEEVVEKKTEQAVRVI